MIKEIKMAFFLKDLIDRADIFFYKINSKLENIFDIAPNSFSLPKTAPADIPRIEAVSSDERYYLSISSDRIYFAMNIQKDQPQSFKEFKTLLIQFANILLEEHKIFRIGLISKCLFGEEDTIKKVRDKYIKDEITSDFNELFLRYNIKKEFQNLKINDVTLVNASKEGFFNPIINKNEFSNCIVLEKDINNVPLEQETFTKELMEGFINNFYECLSENSLKKLI